MDTMSFKALFEYSSIGIIISNKDGTIEKCNPFAAKVFGYEEDELVGQKVEVLIPMSLRDRHVHHRNNYNKDPTPRAMGSTLNLMAVKKSGEIFPVEVSLSYFEDNKVRRVVSFVNDITLRKKAEDDIKKLTEELESKVEERTKELSDSLIELNLAHKNIEDEIEQRKRIESQILHTLEREKELNELKSRFVSMASHEFRTPLGGILTSANLLSKYNEPHDKEKRLKHIQTIKKSVKNLTSILNEFLSLDKLDQGKIAFHPVAFFLPDLVKEILEGFQEEGHQIVEEHENPDVELFQDQDILRNVLINLLSNAIKYSPSKSMVKLKSHLDGSFIVISVQDFGIGIPIQEQKHLFERFFRAHNVNTIQGTGLGLNIVQRYLEIMDGKIEFTSEENKGTTFIVTLPLKKESYEKDITN